MDLGTIIGLVLGFGLIGAAMMLGGGILPFMDAQSALIVLGGTLAATMPAQVPGAVARERSGLMHLLGSRLEAEFNSSFVGSSHNVLWEESEETGVGCRWSGLTGNYIRVLTETGPGVDLANQITETRILASIPGGVIGEVEGISTPGMIESSSRSELPILQTSRGIPSALR